MKHSYLILLLTFSRAILAMEEQNDTANEVVDYYYDLEKTAAENDAYEAMFAAQPLFIQLVVQASKANIANKKPFQELLQKIGKEIKVDSPDEYIGMTKKDGQHRLLSYIPRIGHYSLVNGKKVDLMYRSRHYFMIYNPSELKEKITFSVDHNFESDSEHHAKIIAEFEALIKNKEKYNS